MAANWCSPAKAMSGPPRSFACPAIASALASRWWPHEPPRHGFFTNPHDVRHRAGILDIDREQDIMDGSDSGDRTGGRVGRIIAVSASQAVALIEKSDPTLASDRAWPVEMGALVKVRTRVSTVYGMVSGLRVPLPNLAPSDQELKVVELELAGETLREENGDPGTFRRGVSAHPALDEPVYLASPADLAQVYARPSVATA